MSGKDTPTTTTIFVIRHGMTETTGKILPGRTPGLNLSEAGQNQATEAGKRLAKSGASFSAIYASPMERTAQTAAAISAELDVTVTTEPGLNEADFGTWTGQELNDLRKLPEWKQVQQTPSQFRFPEGESFVELQDRIVQATEKLAAQHLGESIVLVSHADMIKALMAHHLGTHLDNFQRLIVSPCSCSAVLVGADTSQVLFVNNTGSELPIPGLG